jgi:ketosteroid isomerase-like protein
MTNDENAVYQVYQAWCAAFQAVDSDAMKDLFDQDFPGLVYQSEENDEPLYTWEEIDAYWTNAPAIVTSIPEWRELSRKISVDGDTALVYVKLETHLEVAGAKRPLLGKLRASIGLRRTDRGWKIFHYHEGRLVDLAFLFED